MHPDWQTEIARYCEEYSSPEPAFLTDLVRFTWLNTINPRQLSGHLQGRFLAFLSRIIRPECVLEIGTFTGYATHCLTEGLAPDGRVHTIEGDPETAFKARHAAGNRADRIVFHTGNAREILPGLDILADLIFIDADKQSYPEYLDLCLPKLSPRGIMLFDNTLWSGKVADPESRTEDTDTRRMHEFNRDLSQRKDLFVLILPLRDGLTLVQKTNSVNP